jgi:hypothetical protein
MHLNFNHALMSRRKSIFENLLFHRECSTSNKSIKGQKETFSSKKSKRVLGNSSLKKEYGIEDVQPIEETNTASVTILKQDQS